MARGGKKKAAGKNPASTTRQLATLANSLAQVTIGRGGRGRRRRRNQRNRMVGGAGRMGGLSSDGAAYVNCFMGTVGHREADAGVPNSVALNTFRFRPKMTITFLPNAAGQIYLGIVPGNFGGIAVRYGQFTATVWNETTNQWKTVPFNSDTASFGTASAWYVIPWPIFSGPSGSGSPLTVGQAQNIYNCDGYSVTAGDATIMYTGSDLANSGVMYTARQYLRPTKVTNVTQTISGNFNVTGGTGISYLGPQSVSDLGNAADLKVRPLREGAKLKMVPVGDPGEMNDWIEGTCPSVDVDAQVSAVPGVVSFAQLQWQTSTPAVVAGQMNLAGNMQSVFCLCEGVSSLQSVTISADFCYQAAVATSSIASNLATPSPRKDEVAMDVVQQLARELPSSIPASEECDWWCYTKSFAKTAAGVGSAAAEYLPYVGQGVKLAKTLYGPGGGSGALGAISRANQLAIGWRR